MWARLHWVPMVQSLVQGCSQFADWGCSHYGVLQGVGSAFKFTHTAVDRPRVLPVGSRHQLSKLGAEMSGWRGQVEEEPKNEAEPIIDVAWDGKKFKGFNEAWKDEFWEACLWHTEVLSLFLKIFFFLMWTFLKCLLNLLQQCFCSVLAFWQRVMWDLSSLTRDWARTPCIGRWSLKHWAIREVPHRCSLMLLGQNLGAWSCVEQRQAAGGMVTHDGNNEGHWFVLGQADL